MGALYHAVVSRLKRNPDCCANKLIYRYLNVRETPARREHRVKGGDKNPGETFYIIRRIDKIGLFSYFASTLGHIRYAKRKGYVPVVDMMTYENGLIGSDELGKRNGWEYYFEQPCGVTLAEALASKNVILSYVGATLDRPFETAEFLSDRTGALTAWRALARQHIRYSPGAAAFIQATSERVFAGGERCLGVLCRGTDYTQVKPARHPIQPSPEAAIQKAEQVMREQGCGKLFLATEDQDIHRLFKAHFGAAVVNINSSFVNFDGKSKLSDLLPKDANARYVRNLDYLASIAILSRCPCFVGGLTSGTLGAFLLSDGFEYQHVWDLGVYP